MRENLTTFAWTKDTITPKRGSAKSNGRLRLTATALSTVWKTKCKR